MCPLTDEVYRIGGDEFIIILRNLKTSADAEKIAVDASESLSTAFTYKGNQLFVGALTFHKLQC
ncbi:diguanylate cyclase [Clostridium algoriphilum]|uniref:diguanylate cyclase domain-containing protein n=1 Tax=Clostridium algoriphilum TaxID=198347 RepID=UPI001CF0E3C1|nr:diguanylate cyclase [Clostridium algoriphilum]MCB2295605.1 diguanylate cyclase [Clostridium algoriphilum]